MEFGHFEFSSLVKYFKIAVSIKMFSFTLYLSPLTTIIDLECKSKFVTLTTTFSTNDCFNDDDRYIAPVFVIKYGICCVCLCASVLSQE